MSMTTAPSTRALQEDDLSVWVPDSSPPCASTTAATDVGMTLEETVLSDVVVEGPAGVY